MLLSFPGLLDTAAPVAGAAGPAKHGAPPARSAGDDFAALMRKAQGVHADVDATTEAGVATDAKPSADGQGQSSAAEQEAVVLSAAGTEAQNALDAMETLQAQERATHSINTTNLAGFFRSLRVGGSAADASVPAKTASTADAGDVPVPTAQVSSEDAPVAVVVVVPVVPDVAIIAHALPGIGAQNAQGDVADGQVELDVQATPLAAVDQMPAVAFGPPAVQGTDDSPTAVAVDVTAAQKQAVQMAPEFTAAAAVQTQQVVEVELPAASEDQSSTPGSTLPAQAREILASLSAAADAPSETPASQSPVFARPRAVSLVVDAADKGAVPKIKFTMEMGDVVSPRAERMSVTPRVMSPVFVVPHTPAVLLAGATAVTGEITAATLAEAHVTDQIVQSMRMQWTKGGGEATIELNPSGLGKVHVQVRVDRGVVSANVQAETSVVREFVASRRDELVQNLSQQGMRLEKLEVTEPAKEQPTREQQRESRQSPRDAARQRRDERARQTDTFELNEPQENV